MVGLIDHLNALLIKELGVTAATITGYCDGSFRPTIERIIKIKELTRGAVRFEDWQRAKVTAA